MTLDWPHTYHKELQRAQQARTGGNEGMARVCARRAAAEVIREYCRRQEIPLPQSSVLHALKMLSQSKHVAPHIREIAAHFLWQITTEHTLPDGVDLIAEVQGLAQELLPEG